MGFGLEAGVLGGEVGFGDVVAFVDVRAVDLEIHDIGPVFEGDDTEEGEEGVEDVAEVNGVVFGEEHDASDGIDVKEEQQQDGDVEHGGKALEECVDQELELGNGRKKAEDSEEAKESEDGAESSAGGDEADGDDDEIEDVPGVFEKVLWAGGEGDHLDRDFGDEDEEDKDVEELEKRVVLFGCGFVGFDSD